MRLATITNWAYGVTVLLTLASGTTMLLAASAQEGERAAVAQRYELDKATSRLGAEIYALTDRARQFFNTGDPTYRILYNREAAALDAIEGKLRHVRDAGATSDEVSLLKEALRWADSLKDEQRAALAAHDRGDQAQGRQILFGAEYERELDRAEAMVERFQDRLDQRTAAEVAAATQVSRLWRTSSEIVLGVTGALFLWVLYFVFKRRVLHPVVRLSDVVSRLAAQDYAVEPPAYGEVDEIGDMTQALRVFRENGLERQRLEAERNADNAVRDLLARMTQRMQSCDTLADLREVIGRFLPQIAPDMAGKLYLLDQGRQAVVESCHWLDPMESPAGFSPMGCWALRRGLPHRPTGEVVDVPCAHLPQSQDGVPDTLCLPLLAQNQTLGLLYFEARTGSVTAATPSLYLGMVAENVALALANLQLREALREMAMADPLTGLANRRHLADVLTLRLADAQRLGQPVSCVMVDIDHFKGFNDSFGHEAGDTVLREVGAVLKSVVRDDEQVFRFGGEEFLLLLPGFDAAEAASRAEIVRARIGAMRVTHAGERLDVVTASIGVATTPEHCEPDRLVQTADAALYRAKAGGRDQIVMASMRRERDSSAA
jgi:diguanylate cyclase (GGDEF)-like protein